jgi:hypothetical protein
MLQIMTVGSSDQTDTPQADGVEDVHLLKSVPRHETQKMKELAS